MDKFAGAPAPPREVYKGVAAQMAEEHMPFVIDGSASPTKTRSADKDPIVNMNAPGLPPKKSEWMAPQGAGWAPAGWGEGAGEAAYPVAASDASSDMESKPSSGEDVDALLSMRSSSSSLRGLEEFLRAERKRNVVAEAKLQSYEQEYFNPGPHHLTCLTLYIDPPPHPTPTPPTHARTHALFLFAHPTLCFPTTLSPDCASSARPKRRLPLKPRGSRQSWRRQRPPSSVPTRTATSCSRLCCRGNKECSSMASTHAGGALRMVPAIEITHDMHAYVLVS